MPDLNPPVPLDELYRASTEALLDRHVGEPLRRITVEMLEVMAERIAAVLADLNGVMPGFLAPETHAGECWRIHAGCLAAHIRATLTGEDTQ